MITTWTGASAPEQRYLTLRAAQLHQFVLPADPAS